MESIILALFVKFAFPRIPNEAYAADYIAVGKVLKVCVEFSLVEPQGGLHFVVPENPFKHQGGYSVMIIVSVVLPCRD